jgi:hypothetical protein
VPRGGQPVARRAILVIAVSNGARASELLGVTMADLDWGDQLVRVVRKGTGAQQWLPASPDACTWLLLYIADLGVPLRPDEQVWQTLRRRDRGDGLRSQPLNYEALRGVFRRVNAALGANWSMHDLRHTAALRMARDEKLSLRDVQEILGHAHLSTTQVYLVEDQAAVIRRVQQHLAEREQRDRQPVQPAAGYDAGGLAVLLGGNLLPSRRIPGMPSGTVAIPGTRTQWPRLGGRAASTTSAKEVANIDAVSSGRLTVGIALVWLAG